MTIELTPEQERVIGRAIQAGVIRTADDVVDVGVETIRRRLVEQVHALAEDAIKRVEADSIGRPLEERRATDGLNECGAMASGISRMGSQPRDNNPSAF